MDFRQLRAFITVADIGSVTKASAILNIVQPAVTRQLKLLEEDIGAALFSRSRHGMELTDTGKTLLEYARRVLNEIDRARAELHSAQGVVSGIVTVGLLPSTCNLLSSALITTVASRYPGIRVRISMGYAGHLQQWLETGEVDIALLYDPVQNPAIQVTPMLEESIWAVGLPASGLRQDKPVTLRELASHPLILPSPSHGLRILVEHASSMMDLQLSVVAETNAMSIQKNLVLKGHGMTILPSIAVVDDVGAGILAAAPLNDPSLMRRIVLALPGNRLNTTPVKSVVDLLVNLMRDAVEQGDWPAARWLSN